MNTVLVTDEHPTAAFLYVLADERLNVVAQAHTEHDVLTLIGELRPDVVVLDRELAGFDALGCLHEVVATSPGVKIVVASTSADQQVMREAFRHGACGFIVHDGDAAELPTAIWRVLGGSTYEEVSSRPVK